MTELGNNQLASTLIRQIHKSILQTKINLRCKTNTGDHRTIDLVFLVFSRISGIVIPNILSQLSASDWGLSLVM